MREADITTDMWANNRPIHKFKPRMRERSLEELMDEKPDEIEAVRRAFDRIGNMSILIRRIDTGDIPLGFWGCGEKRIHKIFDRKFNQWFEREEPVQLPIKDLRKGLGHIVFDERNGLHARHESLGHQADDMIDAARTYERKRT